MDHTRSFYGVLVNTLIANVTTSFLWFALVFWVYLETRSVLATAIIGGAYMLMVAVVGVREADTAAAVITSRSVW